MDNLGNTLRFSRQECIPLSTILAAYRRANQDTLHEPHKTRLEVAHHIATAIISDDTFGVGALASFEAASGSTGPDIETPCIDEQEITIDNQDNTVGTAISWAARELVADSAVMQAESSSLHDVTYSSEALEQVFGEADQDFAHWYTQTMLESGAQAGAWALQLANA